MKTIKLKLTMAIVCLMALSSCGPTEGDRTRKPYRLVEFTQCGAPASPGPAQCSARESEDQCIESFRLLQVDTARQCYGNRWRIPQTYLMSQGRTPYKSSETVELSISFPSLAHGPRYPADPRTKVTVQIRSDGWDGQPGDIAKHMVPAPIPTDEIVRGMVVFKRDLGARKDIIFIPQTNPSFWLECSFSGTKNYLTGKSFLESESELAGCKVNQQIRGNLYARYNLARSLPLRGRHS